MDSKRDRIPSAMSTSVASGDAGSGATRPAAPVAALTSMKIAAALPTTPSATA
jgi:hypothetical protein